LASKKQQRDEQDRTSQIFGALAHPIRLRIVSELARGPMNVSQIMEALEVEQTAVSKHLAVLKSARIVCCACAGRCRIYTLISKRAVRAALAAGEKLLAAACEKDSSAESVGRRFRA
jgi:DNA-binding transcriptional ArsR family regulator